ncbi:conserved hypothetical protein [Vibrio nigripulchritudo MADA3029]|uniref:type VI secretion system baseplate subunit TssK n=1 Tax=Vibrio nigripulchritudo TaxID=28173 RepID=UPI0003B21A3C|nr:type VI secretion system baseplate subunit TssK [Vibrio nigripulchritudo]CCN45717.1 conserved hypothetical protein [Vibrio nigripulchritudo MADA3020]CCN52940.1 conserved hypothetical protein [Vibrio nigripulchritudo MADA3021]CCN61624.1 conserved hypothetical protein [Vibrio nigripulchritudo MADA3029]
MSDFSPIAWCEGMFLRPQHFQQQERAINFESKEIQQLLSPYSWGVSLIKFNQALLKEGQLHLEQCQAIMPDMTLVNVPIKDNAPKPLMVDSETKDTYISLAIPADKVNGQNIASDSEELVTRYIYSDQSVTDNVTGHDEEILQLASLRVQLKVTNDKLPGYHSIRVAKIKEVTTEGEVLLDQDFIPPSLNANKNETIHKYLNNIVAMIKIRADALAQRLGQGKSASASAVDFVMLQMLNRHETTLRHFSQCSDLHPFQLTTALYGLIGELATFSTKSKRPPVLPKYKHGDMAELFHVVHQMLSQYLSVVLEQTATKLPLEIRQYGIRVSSIPDKNILSKCQFVLAIKADVASEELRKRLPSQIKIGPVENIRDLINNQLHGIAISPLTVVPRQIPYQAGYQYFEVTKKGPYWQRLTESGGLAIHISGNYPGIDVELWTINQ